jgi:hypothetical protein
MRAHGIDGAAVQRFVSELPNPVLKSRRDHLLNNVQQAAEGTGRAFFIVYDISGANPQTVVDDVRRDWQYIMNVLQLNSGGAYLRDHGKPVVELWGFGFADRPGTAAEVATLIDDLKGGRNGLQAATVIGGLPTFWRTLREDSKTEAAWAKVYRSYDVISPWSVGRFADNAGADSFVRNLVQPDVAETHRLGLRYMPVIFPGFSWSNLMRNRGALDKAVLNKVPRSCGKFLWHQVSDLLQIRVDSLYVAMFDEADEGTAVFPVATQADALPSGTKMVYLNEDGCSLPADWYLRVSGAAADFLHRGEAPPRELDKVLRP